MSVLSKTLFVISVVFLNLALSDQFKENKLKSSFKQLRAASLGWNFVTAPLVGGAMGYGLDYLFSTYPWIMVVGLVLGFVSAFREILRSGK